MHSTKKTSKLKKNIFKAACFLTAAIALFFLCKSFSGSWSELKKTTVNLNLSLFFAASLIYAAAFTMMAQLWTSVQHSKNENINTLTYMDIFITTAFARYIPGGIWNIAGKAACCIKLGAPAGRTSGAICIEYLFNILSALTFTIFFIPLISKYIPYAGIIVSTGCLISLLLLPQIIKIGLNMLDKLFKTKSQYDLTSKKIYAIFFGYTLMWTVTGFGICILLAAVRNDSTAPIFMIAPAYPIAWVAGFLSPAPNGIGVRELVLQFLMDDSCNASQTAILLISARCWCTVGELIALAGIKTVKIVQQILHKNKNIYQNIFISTKNLDYLRNVQELNILNSTAKTRVIALNSKSYAKRCIYVFWKLLLLIPSSKDTIFIGFAPQLVLPFWYWKFRKNKITIDFFISLYDTFVCDRQVFSPGSLLAKTLLKLDKITLQLADEIICDTREHGKFFSSFLGADPQKIKVLYLEADKKIYSPKLYPLHQFDGKTLHVLYFGSILPLQGVDTIIETIAILKNQKDIFFHLIGPLKHEQQQKLLNCTANVELITYLEQKQLAEKISQSDLCLAGHFNPKIEKAARTIPGKAYIYAAMGKPMILGDTPANRELFAPKTGKIIFSPRGNAKALADNILKFKEFISGIQK